MNLFQRDRPRFPADLLQLESAEYEALLRECHYGERQIIKEMALFEAFKKVFNPVPSPVTEIIGAPLVDEGSPLVAARLRRRRSHRDNEEDDDA